MSAVKSQCFFQQSQCSSRGSVLRAAGCSEEAIPGPLQWACATYPLLPSAKVSTAPSASTGYSGLTNPKILRHVGFCSPGFSTNSTHIISAFTPLHPLSTTHWKCTAQHKEARWPVAASNCPAAPFSNAVDSTPPFCSPCHSPSAFLPRRQGPKELGRAV